MANKGGWKNYVDVSGDFELAAYIYDSIIDLMKTALDLGTLLSSDQARLRAYKEQIKGTFKGRWLEIAQALESFDIIVPCGCPTDEYCPICKGSRYRLNDVLSPDELREISVVVGKNTDDPKLTQKLEEGLARALKEVKAMDLP